MLQPYFEELERKRASLKRGGIPQGEWVLYYGRLLHPNPKFWKYYFYLFTAEADKEGPAFFCDENRLCIHEYEKRAATLRRAGKIGFVYNERLPRRGPEPPFDEDHERWSDAEWAPPLHEDPDPPVDGGHR